MLGYNWKEVLFWGLLLIPLIMIYIKLETA